MNRAEIIHLMGKALGENGKENGKISYVYNAHYILGMKRISHDPASQQTLIRETSEHGPISLLHGEIHNYQELCDESLGEGEVCLGDLDLVGGLYRREGIGFGKKLNGLFSLGILDKNDRSFYLVTDRFGMAHQIYWTISGKRFFFATHLKGLLNVPGIRKEMDWEGVNLFLKYSYIPSPWTVFNGIRKLPPGHLLRYKNGEVHVAPYWEFECANRKLDLPEAIAVYRDLLKKSIRRRMGGNGKVGILLSGGLDSSANVALASECTPRKLKTFSIGFDDPKFDERPYARIVSKRFNTEHHEYAITGREIEDLPKLVWQFEEPYFEFGLFLTYMGLTSAGKEVEVVIGGEGADQLFGTGGFAKGRPAAMRYLLMKGRLLELAGALGKGMQGKYFRDYDNRAFQIRMLWDRITDLNNWYFYGYDEHELRKLYRDPKLAIIPKVFPYVFSQHSTLNTQHLSFADFYLQTQINQDLKHYVNENVMVKSGRMADMIGITLREAYLDTEITDFLVGLDYDLKRKGSVFDHLKGKVKTKWLHRRAMEGILPPEIMNKPKQGGFVPVKIFLKNPELRRKIFSHLEKSKVINEYFRPDFLKDLFAQYEKMDQGNVLWANFYNSKANRILFLLTFEIWHSQFIESNSLAPTLPSLSEYLEA